MLRVLDLFSGIGGFSLGLERTGGFETVAFCEIDPFCRKVLAKHWPDVPIYHDVRELTDDTAGPADIITAGFPCQDVSHAGRGAGVSGERSGLYREVVRAIRLVRPDYAVMENVAALLGNGMGRVLGDVAESGYDAEWDCIPGQALGAPHQRDRTFIVAHPEREGREGFIPGPCIFGSAGTPYSQPLHRTSDEWRGLANRREYLRDNDGVSVGMERNRVGALGNAVVPAIVEVIGRAILDADPT